MSSGERRFPNPVQSSFLRACLLPGDNGRHAFTSWLAEVGDAVDGLRRNDWADKNLFALLHHARAGDPELPPALVSILRAATAHEQLRNETFAGAAADALGRLEHDGVEPLVIGGTALAYSTYQAPELRHCGNVDLLVADPVAAAEALGYERVSSSGSIRVLHPSGTRLALHRSLYRERWRRDPEGLVDCGVAIEIAGRPALAAGPADLLVAGCANALSATQPGLRFLADAWFLVTAGLDWDRMKAHAAAARAAIPTLAVLGELERLTREGAPDGLAESLGRARLREGLFGIAAGGARLARRLR